MKTIHLISLLALVTIEATAQDSKSRISIRDVQVQMGGLSSGNYAVSLTDFNKLADHSVLLNNDFTSYYTGYGTGMNNNTVFSAMLGLHFLNKEHTAYKSNPVLRAGISYFSGETMSYSLSLLKQTPADTLVSSGTGQVYYIDSVTTEYYDIYYHASQLRLDASLIFSTNPEARWALYGGIGLNTGVSLNANTQVNYAKYENMRSYSNNLTDYNYYPDNSTFVSESFRNKNNFSFSAYLPMGVDFRMARKNEFWKRIHLCYEMRPGITSTVIPELYTVTTGSIQYSFGIKISW